MIAYLSPEWLDELNAALARSDQIPKDTRLRLGYRIWNRDAHVEYTIVVMDGTAAVHRGIGDADVVFEQTIELAAKLATEQLAAYEAFMTGQLVIRGDPQRLVGVDTRWLDAATGDLRSRTDYPSIGPGAAGSGTSGR